MKRNIVIPAAVTAVLLLVISGVRESRYTYETQPGGCVQVQGGGFAGRQYPGGMSMGTGTGGGLLFWVDQGGPELELTAEFPDRAVPVTVSLGELGGTDGTPVFGEIAVEGETILTAEFTSFSFCDIISETGTGQAGLPREST